MEVAPSRFVIGNRHTARRVGVRARGFVFSRWPVDMANGLDSFPLLAIPFFILAGELMASGGLARRMIDFASSMVGTTCRVDWRSSTRSLACCSERFLDQLQLRFSSIGAAFDS